MTGRIKQPRAFRDRNFSATSCAAFAARIGVLGFYLPFTINLQSVLGFSPVKAGLTMAPAALASAIAALAAGWISDRMGGKYILMAGLSLLAVALGWIALIAQTNSAWQDFLAPQLAAGIGLGCTFTPMISVAMRGVDPRRAGAASGVFNTICQTATVVGTAGVGALLENRLVSAFARQATLLTAGLPARARTRIITGFQAAGGSGLGVGSGRKPAGLTGQILTHGFLQAMGATMATLVVILFGGLASCLAIKQRLRSATADSPARMTGARTVAPAPRFRAHNPGDRAGRAIPATDAPASRA
jgi:MFS family permease